MTALRRRVPSVAAAPELTISTFGARLRRPGRKLTIGGAAALVLLVFIAVRTIDLRSTRAQALRASDQRASSLALVLTEYLHQAFSAADLSLRQLAVTNQRIRGPNAPDADWLPILVATRAGLPAIGSISIVDSVGIIRHSTQPLIIGQSRHDEYVFQRMAAGTTDDLIAGPPFRSLTGSGTLLIPLGRRLTTADGRFVGGIVATFVPDALHGALRSANVGKHGMVSVFHRAGTVIAREPNDLGATGEIAAGTPLFDAVLHVDTSGFFRGPATAGGPILRTALHSLNERPLVVGVSLDEIELLGDWRREVALSVSLGFLAVMTLSLMLRALFRQLDTAAAAAAAFARSQRLEALGQLTGGVAHDFNNLLTIILANVDLLQDDPALGGAALDVESTHAIEEIGSAAIRARELIRQLLAFARRQPLRPRIVGLNSLVCGSEQMLRRILGEDVTVRLELAERSPLAEVDPVQFESTLLNLCANARDAMTRGGVLTVSTSVAVLDAEYARENTDVVPGRYAMVAAEDTGCGIAPHDLPRVFDPFFTTKDVGHGTGLGLSTVYGFVKQSGGHVKVTSEVGCGTTVRLYFPEAAGAVAPPGPCEPAIDLRGHGEVVLLVEDEAGVREIAARLLEGLGYNVVSAQDGQSALDVASRLTRLDVLLTDAVLPGGMSGGQIAAELTRLRPALRVIYASGYSKEIVRLRADANESLDFLSKPYDRGQLAAAVHAALKR